MTPATPSTPSVTPRPRRALSVMFGIAILVLAADTISTALALDKLAGHPAVRMLNGLITVHLTLNAGAAFGFGTSCTSVICLFGCGVILAIIVQARLRSLAWTIALGLLLGGSAANLGDRLFRPPGLPACSAAALSTGLTCRMCRGRSTRPTPPSPAPPR
jgi:signal peptidase II